MTAQYGPREFARDFSVSRETLERFEQYAALLGRWGKAVNLIGPATASDIWRRHFADSAQLLALAPSFRTWVDLGSGAGFPGLVIAILTANQEDRAVHLVESNARKCAFLSDVARRTGVEVRVHDKRVADATREIGVADVVSARALAPLPDLLGHAVGFMRDGGFGLFPKGRDAQKEIEDARRDWAFQWKTSPSRTDSEAQIIKVWSLEAKRDKGL
ncbi:MAG: 16S rRNA (guanine(527)-N(7))-methyltransferase RsmG [Hyphomicrobiales bacterium]|nr:16S rRNA (guanine(527)-N(7))-methyltransferase RsmG [Hyphomicrobiales bacterium]